MPFNWLPYFAGAATAIAGALITGFFTIWVNRQAHKRQLERDRLEYERNRRDAKRERIRQEYATILEVAQTFLNTKIEFTLIHDKLLSADEDSAKEQRLRERLSARLWQAISDLDKAKATLLLDEPDLLSKGLRGMMQAYVYYLEGTFSFANLAEVEESMRREADELQTAIQERMAKMG